MAFVIARESIFRLGPPALVTAVILRYLPAAIQERKIREIRVGRHVLLPEVSAAAVGIFAAVAAVWHFTVESFPGWRKSWYIE
jgi:hypothetical protein